ncbi:HSP20-like chaperone [Marasmius fiardii PR-910]|nr:HSP20-like chaperone [Marasmius fiardii PR-910]
MSIRQLLHEFRPLFRLLEEPIARPPSYFGLRTRPFFEDPFLNSSPAPSIPAVDITEDGNKFIVEADLPGFQKENVEVRVGDGGHSITISGKAFDKQSTPQLSEAPKSGGETSQGVIVQAKSKPNQLSAERRFVTNSQFTRTVWLPQPVDRSGVAARLKDGVLTVTIPKVEDKGSVVVPVE